MISTIIPAQGTATVTFAASDKIATFSEQQYEVLHLVGYPNHPSTEDSVFEGTGLNVTAAFSAAGTAVIKAGATPVLYTTGASAAIPQNELVNYQATPGTLNATGALTTALLLTGIVTSSTAAAVTATLDTGAVTEAALDMQVNDSFDWRVINTGGANAFVVTAAATGHTVVGTGVTVAAGVSATFRTRKTAFETFVTYCIG
jgi:hypothetical protein